MEEAPLRRQVRTALLWRSGSQIAAQLLVWLSTLVVIRLLAPADYGLMAMTAVVTTLLAILSGGGFASAIVQSESISDADVRRIFGLLLLLNGALALLQVAAAPLAADYYDQPMIAPLLRVLALTYVLIPFSALPAALASRDLDFASQGRVQFVASLAAAAATLAGALAGWGVWALVAGQIALGLTRAIGFALARNWLTWPSWRFAGMGGHIRFGGLLTIGSILWFAWSQADIIIGGRLLGAREIGLYSTALFLAQLPVAKFLPALSEVGYSAYARIQSDRAAMARHFLTAARMVALATFPFYLGLAATAESFAAHILGPAWLDAGRPIAILALAMPVYTIFNLYAPATNALGRPALNAYGALAGVVVMPLAFWLLVGGGAAGLATAWLLVFPLVAVAASLWSLPAIGVSARALAGALAPALFASLLMGAAVWTIGQALPATAWALALQVASGVALYALLLRLLFPAAWRALIDLARR